MNTPPEFRWKAFDVQIDTSSQSYRPPSWPPPADWVVTIDSHGPKSRFRDGLWDFSASVGRTAKLDIAGGRHKRSATPLSAKNQDLLRLVAVWIFWGPWSAFAWSTLKNHFDLVRRIFSLCDENNILASDLNRFPRVLAQVPKLYSQTGEQDRVLTLLDRLLRSRSIIRFVLIDEIGLARMSTAFNETKSDKLIQTAYIPPRIWKYQLSRLRACLDDYLTHKQKVEECFNFCVDAYVHNFGSLTEAFAFEGNTTSISPFVVQRNLNAGGRTGRKFLGPFYLTAQRFGIDSLLQRWIDPPKSGDFELRTLSTYLSLVQAAACAYLLNFTLQRKEEAGDLRSDCLIWEDDETLGPIPIIRGDTTKTDPDDDARWPTSPNVSVAIDAVTSVSRLRMRCAAENPKVECDHYDKSNPLLFHVAFEPWSSLSGGYKPYSTRPKIQSYQAILLRYPRLFDIEQIRITKDDLDTACLFTPNLKDDPRFQVGKPWPFAYHQLRRTSGVNMFASGMLSDSSIQVIMKHQTLLQTRYYGSNHTRLRFNAGYEDVTTSARYEVMARQICALVEDRYVSPLGVDHKNEIVVNLLGTRDLKALRKAAEKGEISFRDIRLGGCTNREHCPYGGIESLARCAGGDGHKPCADVLYDKTKRTSLEGQLQAIERRIAQTTPGSPRSKALQAEAQAIRNYLDVT